MDHSVKIPKLFYNCCDNADVGYALRYFQQQPLLPFVNKLSVSQERFGQIPKLYVECLQDNAINIADQRRMYSKVTSNVLSSDTDHSPFFSAKEALTKLISDAA